MRGPGSPYTLLFDDDDAPGPGLPAGVRAIYGGDWRLRDALAERPYTFTNFVVSHDGRISFDEPGRAGGGEVSRNVAHDTWLMALLRSRADAILTGAGTLRVTRRHRWTPWEPFPDDQPAFAALRAAEGRAPLPILVVVSGSGALPADAAALHVPGQPVLVATTSAGAARTHATLAGLPQIAYHVSPGDRVDFSVLLRHLRHEHGVRSLLSEGGAQVYGQLIASRLIDEVFTTISPIIVGNRSAPAAPRPSLVEGAAFDPNDPPRLRLISLRRHGDFLFQRARLSSAS
ncbi:MAG: dihydrofolate reductase family protein [Chloroflexi bacterium]|nr:dihydrofolate reductase family protein [Chloroflexota bacterium]